mgnify:CR=1 FL=1
MGSKYSSWDQGRIQWGFRWDKNKVLRGPEFWGSLRIALVKNIHEGTSVIRALPFITWLRIKPCAPTKCTHHFRNWYRTYELIKCLEEIELSLLPNSLSNNLI